jgi:imidazolonepropionase-like amidohydrolase
MGFVMAKRLPACLKSLGLMLALCGGVPVASAADTALVNAGLIDGDGGPRIASATIILHGDRIAGVGATGTIAIPADATVIDCTGKTIMPGLISDHSHLGLVDGVESGPGHYTRENVLRQLRQYEAYGVTTITSLGINSPLFYELREPLHAGKIPGADIFGADRGIGAPNTAPPVSMTGDGFDRPATPDEARADVRQAAERKPDLIKFWLDDFNGSMPTKMSPEIYAAIIDEAHRQHLRVAGHIYYLKDATDIVKDGVDIVAHGVRNQAVDAEFVQQMKTHGAWYIPTLDLNESFYIYAEQPAWMAEPFFQNSLQPALKAEFDDASWRTKTLAHAKLGIDQNALLFGQRNLKTVFDAGIRIGFGTDSGATPLRIAGFAEHRELQLMVDSGLTPMQVITIATRDAAKLLALDDRGVLAAGKLADLIVLDGDPSVDIKNADKIESVWHRGQQVSGKVDLFKP